MIRTSAGVGPAHTTRSARRYLMDPDGAFFAGRSSRQVGCPGRAALADPTEVVAISKSVCKDRIDENIDVFDFELTQDEMSAIATMDTGISLFFDHRDPDQVGRLGTARLDI